MTILYQIDNKGQLRTWEISVVGFIICIEYGLINGAKVTQEEAVSRGLGGRSIDEQIESRVNSRINKQLAKGYRRTIEEARKCIGQNELNLYKPMLAQQFNKQSRINTSGAVLQRKLDGNRMLVTKQDGNITCYTRNGKPIETLDHIVEQMQWLEEGQTIDGEVYIHGMPLKDINSRIRKKQKGTIDLNYHIYDVIDDSPFKERFDPLITKGSSENVIIEPYWLFSGKGPTESLFNEVRGQGYEGLMMRLDNVGYQAGKRSKGLLKIKYRYDAEYEVIDIEVAKDGTGILVMRLPNGDTVSGVAPGTKHEKIHVADNPEKYIGRMCTCSFAYLTEFGVPFHLTCDNWRD